MPDIAVVITTHDNTALLPSVLEALGSQVGVADGSCEVVLVDNGSADRVAGRFTPEAFPFKVTVVEQRHTGQAWARNQGWKRAAAPLILFIDDDLVPDRRLLAEHLDAHARHPGAVVLGLINTEPGLLLDPWTDYDRAKLLAKYTALRGREKPSGIHVGGNFSLPRWLLDQVGGFDHRLPGRDHVDLGFRLKELGVRFVFRPGAQAFRHWRPDYERWRLTYKLQGRLDVAAFQERGHAGGLPSLVACYHDRNPVNRMAVAVALSGRSAEGLVLGTATWLGLTAHRLRMRPLSRAAMSVVANVVYWGGVRDGLRGRAAFWALVRRTRRHVGRPYEVATGAGT